MFIAGDHVPLIPFVEIKGKSGIISPAQYGPTGMNVGIRFVSIIIVRTVVVAHCPAVGVNV